MKATLKWPLLCILFGCAAAWMQALGNETLARIVAIGIPICGVMGLRKVHAARSGGTEDLEREFKRKRNIRRNNRSM